jgi:hypothetical protein
MQSISRRTLAQAASSFVVAAGLLSFVPSNASAQSGTDWSAIRDALHADGIVQPGNVLCFDLVRKDLNVTVAGKPVSPAEVANGYVHFKPLSNGTFYVNGSLPAQDWQASYVAAALHSTYPITVSALVNHGAKSAPNFIWVHFEATATTNQLLPNIVKALSILKDPQIGVTARDLTVPPAVVPPRFRALFSKGTLTQINDVYSFGVARPDEHLYFLGRVPANPFLGVGEYVVVQSATGDGTQLTFNCEFALRSDEVQPVIHALQAGGFTVSALHDHFIDDHSRLYFVHGFAMGTNQASTTQYETALYQVFQLIHAHQQ